jgi:hypothetical protein
MLEPMIFMSDANNLLKISANMKAWQIYITIGNLSAAAWMKYTMHGILLIGFLPIAIKMREVSVKRIYAQWEYNQMVLLSMLQHVL